MNKSLVTLESINDDHTIIYALFQKQKQKIFCILRKFIRYLFHGPQCMLDKKYKFILRQTW